MDSNPDEKQPVVDDRKAGIEAWHDAKTEAEQKAAVEKFPWLRHIFCGAHNHHKQ